MTEMQRSLTRFSREVYEFKEAVPEKIYKPFRDAVAIFAFKSILDRTPVKSGRAKANWQVGVNGSNYTELNQVDPDGGTTFVQGVAAIHSAPPWATVHIFNNASYILSLENGRSQKAPTGMVTPTLAALSVFVK